MNITNNARATLRFGTAEHHQQVDHIFSKAALSDRAGFARFLMAQAGAHFPVEEALDRNGAASMIADWPARRRSALLKADLEAFGLGCPPPVGTVCFEGIPAVLGGIYVLEGSRLGGALLKRSVPDGWPASFLAPAPSGSWRLLLNALDEHLTSEEDIAAAVEAACRVFRLFERSGRQFLGVECS